MPHFDKIIGTDVPILELQGNILRSAQESRCGWSSQERIKPEVSDVEHTFVVDYMASRKGREGLSVDMRDQTRPPTILGGQERRTGLINRGYICYRRARGWMAIVRRRDSSQLALITATRRGLTVRSRIMPIGAEPVCISTWDRRRGVPFEHVGAYKLTVFS